jgi:hypothetical protein
MSEESTRIGATIALPQAFVLVQASNWDSEPEEGRAMGMKGMTAISTGAPTPICVIDSLRYVGQSRHYSSHGTTTAGRHRASAAGRASGHDARSRS